MINCHIDNPWWGTSDSGEAPERIFLFPRGDTGDSMMMEDFLQHNEVFINMTSKRPCHSDSYGTLIDYAALDAALKLLNDAYSPTAEDWLKHVTYWTTNPNMQPPLRLIGRQLKLQYDITTSPDDSHSS